MNHSFFLKIIIVSALSLVPPCSATRGEARATKAPPPPAHRTHEVSTLVGQLAKDASTMADAARETRDNPRVGIEAITRLDALYHAADHLYRLLMDGNPSVQTLNEYLAVRQTYLDARPYFDGLPGNDAVRAAIWRTRDNILSVASIYLGDYHEAEDEARRVSPEPPADTRLRQMAADIARRSAALARKAYDQQLRGARPKAEWRPFVALNEAAQNFYEYLAIHGDADGGAVRERYETLVRRMQDARDVVGDFLVDFQSEFKIVWGETDQLYKIAPEIHLGTLSWRDLYQNPPPGDRSDSGRP